MNYRGFFKFMVLVLGILFANLLTIWIDNCLLTYRWQYSPHTFTWIGMGVVLCIYFPLFKYMDKWATTLSDKFLKAGKKFGGRKLGSFLAFFVGLLVLFFFYGLEWFNTNVFKSMVQSVHQKFF
jgi:hypothetical protein